MLINFSSSNVKTQTTQIHGESLVKVTNLTDATFGRIEKVERIKKVTGSRDEH